MLFKRKNAWKDYWLGNVLRFLPWGWIVLKIWAKWASAMFLEFFLLTWFFYKKKCERTLIKQIFFCIMSKRQTNVKDKFWKQKGRQSYQFVIWRLRCLIRILTVPSISLAFVVSRLMFAVFAPWIPYPICDVCEFQIQLLYTWMCGRGR